MIWSLRDDIAQESTNGRRPRLHKFSNTEALEMIDDTIFFDTRFLIVIKKKND